MAALLLAAPFSYFTDANGAPLAGGKVYTYIAGTTTPQNSYTNSSATIPAANPVILDSAGRAEIWLQGFYKIIVKDSLDNTIHTTDNVTGVAATGDMTAAVYDPAAVNEQLVGLTAVQTLTNKTLTAANLGGTTNLSGGQIKFPATQSASSDVNTLDDYEEGTWTPVLSFGTPGNLTVVYSTQVGIYTKIGNTVTISGALVTTTFTHTTASGNSIISGLPFATNSISGMQWYSAATVQGITKASYTQFGMYIGNSATSLICNGVGSGQPFANITTAECASGTQQTRFFTLTYQSA